eukprot:TRINITY_DN7522_c0_g1_i1.p1 TRINITY_DN7522_c0_g1~~TRINITY_DN7522_c0_g1_i1.p1  ORF type:complete len:438 (+),score=80.39 TRINITY_DN7522_c0_g1_i1:563-1876(+)
MDVKAVIKYARKNDCTLGVAAGRHSHLCMVDDCLLVDFSKMKKIDVDVPRKVISIQPGVKIGDLDSACQPHNLIIPLGHNPDTGVAGLTLGGGLGYFSRKYGATCDSLIEVEIVLPNGDIIIANSDKNPDLFWAVRGGGGNFGIVTRFTYNAYDIPPQVVGGMMVYPKIPYISPYIFPDTPTLLRRYVDHSNKMTDEEGSMFVIIVGGMDLVIYTNCDTIERGKQGASKIHRNIGFTPFNTIYPTNYHSGVQKLISGSHSERQPPGNYYQKELLVNEMSNELLDDLAAAKNYSFFYSQSYAMIVVILLGGKMSEVPTDATAFYARKSKYWILLNISWKDQSSPAHTSAAKEEAVTWIKSTHNRLMKYASGNYSALVGDRSDGSVGMVSSKVVHGDNLKRLEQIKNKYDPENILRLNRNIVITRVPSRSNNNNDEKTI